MNSAKSSRGMSQNAESNGDAAVGDLAESIASSGSYRWVEEEFEASPEDFDEFVQKYGDVKVKYIKKPQNTNTWYFTRPYALNFFYKGTLYRTRQERGESGKTELFLDLLYVGIVGNLASQATEEASGASLLRYLLLFLPVYQVWADIKDFMDYYFNEDLSQKLYILWIIILLTIYSNNTSTVLESHAETAMCVVPYMLCRFSLAISQLIYSLFIPQHRFQMRFHATSILITTWLWIPVIFGSTRLKIGLTLMNLVLEHIGFTVAYHGWTRRLFKLKYSTAVNIEHEVERVSAFYVIAIGEFLYKVVTGGALGAGFTARLARGIMLLVIAYVLLWLYFNGEGSLRAVHALRRSSHTAMLWIWAHIPLIASLILAADASGDLCLFTDERTWNESGEGHLETGLERRSEESGEGSEASRRALAFFFTGGLGVALICLFVLAIADKSLDSCEVHAIPKFWRIFPRIPVALLIIFITFADLGITKLFGFVMAVLVALLLYELFAMMPRAEYCGSNREDIPDPTEEPQEEP
ncbi:unnamed protein product [Kuraishia capsulata CBS 1993]|uniref:Uncharacterized protein n=1 Tax=Kuraishia capsulata CBS 1993 TaxID=1382522 RepID=W6MJ90_9ASCO|nr:uncharacterized protein KUCA_T00002551001 [Kuraishia capsulata CBS 1993]CDK26579.1 unnamed protein product [Kuraishia capsulata CBS 1993]